MAEDGTQNGGDEYRTFAGAGFGTLMVRLASGPKETPPVASSRAYLRDALPAVYQEGDFGMRFVGALETLLDPIVAVLDALPAHFSADHAPRDVLDLLSAWLGVDLDESQTPAQRRAMVRQAAELGRRRGTRAGLELALSLGFPKLPLRVEDLGGVRTAPPEGGVRGARLVHRVLRQADRGGGAGGRRALHRAVQAGTHDVPIAREGSEAEGRRRARMRTCQSCGRENPADRDFCECGEYLRWDPTGVVEAVTPELAAAAAAEAAAPAPRRAAAPPRAAAAPPPPPPPPPRRLQPPRPPGRRRPRTQVHAAAGAGPGSGARARAGDDHAAPARRGGRQERDAGVGVHPGRAGARAGADPQPVRDRRQLPDLGRRHARGVVLGAARHRLPGAVRLGRHVPSTCPFPRPTSRRSRSTCTRRARPRPRRGSGSCRSPAQSKAQERTVATAPLLLGIQPFEQHDTKVKPERASGRRKADFQVAVSNKANAPVYVAFAAKRPTTTATSRSSRRRPRSRRARRSRRRLRVRAAQADLDRPPARAPPGRPDQVRRGGARRSRRPRASRTAEEALERRRPRRQAQGQGHPRRARPADLQAAGPQAERQPRSRRPAGVEADGARPAGRSARRRAA